MTGFEAGSHMLISVQHSVEMLHCKEMNLN